MQVFNIFLFGRVPYALMQLLLPDFCCSSVVARDTGETIVAATVTSQYYLALVDVGAVTNAFIGSSTEINQS